MKWGAESSFHREGSRLVQGFSIRESDGFIGFIGLIGLIGFIGLIGLIGFS